MHDCDVTTIQWLVYYATVPRTCRKHPFVAVVPTCPVPHPLFAVLHHSYLFCCCCWCCVQLVIKILRNAYIPLPSGFSRSFKQLVGMMLRADPDDRPTTTNLLKLSLVRKHLQLMLGLVQVPRGSGLLSGISSSSGQATTSQLAGAVGVDLEDMQAAMKLMAKAPGPARRTGRVDSPIPASRGSSSSTSGSAASSGQPSVTAAGTRQTRGAQDSGVFATPVAATRGKTYEWDLGAQYEQDQRQAAEKRYQARIMEQRMAREQVKHQGQAGYSHPDTQCVH